MLTIVCVYCKLGQKSLKWMLTDVTEKALDLLLSIINQTLISVLAIQL